MVRYGSPQSAGRKVFGILLQCPGVQCPPINCGSFSVSLMDFLFVADNLGILVQTGFRLFMVAPVLGHAKFTHLRCRLCYSSCSLPQTKPAWSSIQQAAGRCCWVGSGLGFLQCGSCQLCSDVLCCLSALNTPWGCGTWLHLLSIISP